MLSIHLERPIDEAKIKSLRHELAVECTRLGVNPEASAHLLIVGDELCCNVMEHSDASWMEVSLDKGGEGELRMVVRDDGQEFSPVEAAELFDEPAVGGQADRHMGLWIIKQTDLKVSYQRDGAVNQTSVQTRLAGELGGKR